MLRTNLPKGPGHGKENDLLEHLTIQEKNTGQMRSETVENWKKIAWKTHLAQLTSNGAKLENFKKTNNFGLVSCRLYVLGPSHAKRNHAGKRTVPLDRPDRDLERLRPSNCYSPT